MVGDWVVGDEEGGMVEALVVVVVAAGLERRGGKLVSWVSGGLEWREEVEYFTGFGLVAHWLQGRWEGRALRWRNHVSVEQGLR